MKKSKLYFKNILFTYFCSICFFQISKVESSEIQVDSLRILKLIPENWLDCPGIEPAIPSDYIMKDVDSGFYMLWGKKDDLEKLPQNKKDQDIYINLPVFQIHIATDIMQTGSLSFSREGLSEEDIKSLKELGMHDFVQHKTTWGVYPVIVSTLKLPNKQKVYMAWVGLNSEAGHVWWISLVSPLNKEKETEKIWNKFINNTKQLSEPEYFIAKGMDMRNGYTNYKIATASLKVIAEKKANNQIAIMVEPLQPNITFKIIDIKETWMGSQWKWGQPCVKVYGRLIEKNGNSTNIILTTITVLTKKVINFSFDLNQEKHAKNVEIFTNPSQPKL